MTSAECVDFDAETRQVREDRATTSVVLYSEQPILTAGLQTVMAGLDDFSLSAVFTALGPLVEHIRTHRSDVVLVDMPPAATFTTLSELKSVAGDASIILWVDSATTPLVSQALALGVRGILRKSLPLELQIKCLRKVAAGDLWVEQGVCDELLTTKRVSLTRRERQLVGLLAQGLKNKEIAYSMTLAEGTVKCYLSRLFEKVGAKDRFELALFALKNFFADAAGETAPARTAGQSWPTGFSPSFVSLERPRAVS